MVADFGDIELIADAGTNGGDQRAHFVVGKHAVEPAFLDVEDLAAQREDSLEASVAALLGTPAGAVTFDDEEFAVGGVVV